MSRALIGCMTIIALSLAVIGSTLLGLAAEGAERNNTEDQP